jgi:hypothetical protein
MGKRRNTYRLLVGKPEGSRCRWVNNIKMAIREMGGEWTGLVWLTTRASRELL